MCKNKNQQGEERRREITTRVYAASPSRRDSKANYLSQSLHPRYFNIGYGNKLRIDLEAGFTLRIPAQPRLPPSPLHQGSPSPRDSTLPRPCRDGCIHVNRRSHIITLNDTRYEHVTSTLRKILER